MGDLQHLKILDKLQLNANSAQWILYNDDFVIFYDYLAHHIKDWNILEEDTILEYDEIIEKAGTDSHKYDDKERLKEIQELEENYPGLMDTKSRDNDDLTDRIDILLRATDKYEKLLQEMKTTEDRVTLDLVRKERQYNDLQAKEIMVQARCQTNAERLEELQMENHLAVQRVEEIFIKLHSTPLFMHQMPLEEYLNKYDSFKQFIWIHLEEKYEIQCYSDNSQDDSSNSGLLNISDTSQNIGEKLTRMAALMEKFQMGLIKERVQIQEIRGLLGSMDLSKIHINTVHELKRDMHHYTISNKNREVLKETLMNDIQRNIQRNTLQVMETVLYNNTKMKLERARKRYECEELVAKAISNSVLTAELIWIIIQLDLDRKRNRIDNSSELMAQFELCEKRIETMLQNMANNPNPEKRNCNQLITEINKMMEKSTSSTTTATTDHSVSEDGGYDLKRHLYDYKKFTHLLKYSTECFLSGKHNSAIMDKCREIDQLEDQLKSVLSISPVGTILLTDLQHDQRMEALSGRLNEYECRLKHLRKQFQENIIEKMKNNKFWAYSQLLWMWYLVEPSRIDRAIEEIKKAASKGSQIKTLMGIRRKY